MSFQELFENLLADTGHSVRAFLPELTLCATIVLLLLTRLSGLTSKLSAFLIALVGSAVAFYLASFPGHLASVGNMGQYIARPDAYHREIFTGFLVYDNLTVFFRSLLMFFAVLFVLFTRLSGIPDREDAPDFYTLVLGGTLGMCLMASANHLLMVFLAVEMASVPSYALAGHLKWRRNSSEAALKYAVYGAGTSGVMLYGISLLAGVLGTAHLPTMAVRLAELFETGRFAESSTVLMLGGLMMLVGLAFKLSAVPFHFWCPDVFEGATAEVNAFLSVASKAAALALLIRLVVGLGHVGGPAVAMAQAEPPGVQARSATDAPAGTGVSSTAHTQALAPVREYLLKLICLLAVVTCTFGNLAAYGQTNIKRLLAYSTIAHAGYLMMPVAAAVAVLGSHPDKAKGAIAALCFYLVTYLFMNLGAFAVVAFLRNRLHSEEIADYAGLVRRSPGLVVCFVVLLLSLLGLPPLAGFPAKVLIFYSLVDAANSAPAFKVELMALFVIGGLNTALSLFYYLRVAKVMVIDPEPADRLPVDLSLASITGAFLVALTLPVLVLGIWWNELNVWAQKAAENLVS